MNLFYHKVGDVCYTFIYFIEVLLWFIILVLNTYAILFCFCQNDMNAAQHWSITVLDTFSWSFTSQSTSYVLDCNMQQQLRQHGYDGQYEEGGQSVDGPHWGRERHNSNMSDIASRQGNKRKTTGKIVKKCWRTIIARLLFSEMCMNNICKKNKSTTHINPPCVALTTGLIVLNVYQGDTFMSHWLRLHRIDFVSDGWKQSWQATPTKVSSLNNTIR